MKIGSRSRTAVIAGRYDRIAGIYDLLEASMERAFKPWREELWSRFRDGDILEVGVGTGKNLPYHPSGARVTGIDIAEGMLERARTRADRLASATVLKKGDAQALAFPDNSFDAAAATFVFCSVPDPILGLREVNRVVKPDGLILLLEHARIDRPIVGAFMDLLNPLVAGLYGANINRRTVENVIAAGLKIEEVEDLGPMGMVKLIVARPGRA